MSENPIGDALNKRVEDYKTLVKQVETFRQNLAQGEAAMLHCQGAIKQLQELGATHPELSPIPDAPPVEVVDQPNEE